MDIPSGEIEASYALPEKVTWRCAAPAPRGTDEDEDRLTQRMAATIAIPITRVVAAPSACSRIATRTGRRRSFRRRRYCWRSNRFLASREQSPLGLHLLP